MYQHEYKRKYRRDGTQVICNAYVDLCDVQFNKGTPYKFLHKARSDDALDP